MISAVGWGVALGIVVLSLALMGIRMYQSQRARVGSEQRARVIAEATQHYEADRLDEANALFRRVLREAPDTPEGSLARTNLARTLNRLGVICFEQGALQPAIDAFREVDDVYEQYPANQSPDDGEVQTSAKTNLQNVRARLPVGPSIHQPPGDLDAPSSTSSDPMNDPASPEAREQQARVSLQEGIAAYNGNDVMRARTLWQRTVEIAPGSPTGIRAQELLDQTTPPITVR